jgi:hypothetical protein
MLLGQLFLAEGRGRNIMAALFCNTDRAGKTWVGTTEVKYIITLRKSHVG